MVDGEQTDKTDTAGKEDNKPVEKPDKPTEEPDKSISLYDKTEKIVTRQEEANKKTEELLNRQEKLFANQRLAGTTGGHVEPVVKDPDQEMADKLLADTE